MKKIAVIVLIFSFFISLSITAAPHNIAEWEKCTEKAQKSVDPIEVGVIGVEDAIEKQCGDRPVDELASVSGIGVSPYDLVRSKTWKKKFVRLTKGKYDDFVKRLGMSETTASKNGWIVGEGFMPHFGGDDNAAFAINIVSGEVFAAIYESKRYGDKFKHKLTGFGFDSSWENAPEFLQKWAKDKQEIIESEISKQIIEELNEEITKREKMLEESKRESEKLEREGIELIINRCQKQMGEYGWAMVKACVDEDIEAKKALQKY